MKNLVKNLFKSKKQQCNIHDVSQQRELLLAFSQYVVKNYYTFRTAESLLDEFLKANNCG